ncbi:MAG: Rpn family recombination-promoting nuclease/putative transposase [Deltaproteobacteria bacterium]|nr:Rpn family recombination-promoting nuclease/putative transposase [Deltaproteobacteria bacterium]
MTRKKKVDETPVGASGGTLDLAPDGNREHKSTIFVRFLDKPILLRDTYNNLSGTNFKELPSILKLDNIFVSGVQNDIAFEIGNSLVVFIEHQSTPSQNLPYRMLQYVAHFYERLYDSRAKYNTQILEFPRPSFIVFYNGKNEYDDIKTLLLSDAFKTVQDQDSASVNPLLRGSLELKVVVYNINFGRNLHLFPEGSAVYQYSKLIQSIRDYQTKKMSPLKAIQTAVARYLGNPVKDEMWTFLDNHRLEVENMVLSEFNYEDFRAANIDDANVLTAKRMIVAGLPDDLIVRISTLPLERIKSLRARCLAEKKKGVRPEEYI